MREVCIEGKQMHFPSLNHIAYIYRKSTTLTRPTFHTHNNVVYVRLPKLND